MNPPKIHAVIATENHQLFVEFENHEKREYDVKPLLNNEIFADLKNVAFFKNVKIEQGGYAISWNDDIDISEYELWCNGTIVR
jgi:tRNA U34 5-carboxymethylaminomethyl modifying enzyme MnmG/GidA